MASNRVFLNKYLFSNEQEILTLFHSTCHTGACRDYFYPKLEPLFHSASDEDTPIVTAGPRALNVDTLQMKPKRLLEMLNSSGTLIPDKQVDKREWKSPKERETIYVFKKLNQLPPKIWITVSDIHMTVLFFYPQKENDDYFF